MIADFDLEADDYLYGASIIWCGNILLEGTNDFIIYHVDTEEEVEYPSGSTRVSLTEFLDVLRDNIPCAHNGISYDLPLLRKLHGFEYSVSPDKVVDTHILSRLYNPDREGHSIQWWGQRFKLYKGEHKDFSRFSNEMLQYNLQDTRILKRIRLALQDEGKDWDWSEAIKLEYNIWDIQSRQEQRGVAFDAAKAEEVLAVIVKEIEEIEAIVVPQIPLKPKNEGELKKIFLKSGEYTEPVKQWIKGENE